VIEFAEQETASLRELLKNPTPENFETVNQKLGGLVAALQSFIAEPPTKQIPNSRAIVFLSRLPSEMAHVRVLLQAPVRFLEGLALFRAQKFGSYNSQGQLRGLEQETSARTLTHL
jgi:hypothetical protein